MPSSDGASAFNKLLGADRGAGRQIVDATPTDVPLLRRLRSLDARVGAALKTPRGLSLIPPIATELGMSAQLASSAADEATFYIRAGDQGRLLATILAGRGSDIEWWAETMVRLREL